MMKKLGSHSLTFLSIVGVVGLSSRAHAATIHVTTTKRNLITDAACGFEEAIRAVNTMSAGYGCSGGDGNNDAIVMAAGATYTDHGGLTINRSVQIRVSGASDGTAGGGATLLTGGVHGLLIKSGTGAPITVTLSDVAVVKDPLQSLPVTCVRIDGSGGGATLNARRVRIADCNASGIHLTAAAGLTLRASVVEGNQNSGIRDVSGSSLWIYDSLIHDNHALGGGNDGRGGGLFFTGDGNNNIYNTTFTDNTAVEGGGIYSAATGGGYLDLYNTTIASNEASARGGGIFQGGNGTPIRIRDTVLASNAGASGGADAWGFINSSRSFHGSVQGNTGSHDNDIYDPVAVLNPQLGPLLDMGGSTRTLPPLAGSPLVDAFVNEGGSEADHDQRGFPRIVGAKEDLGAYEAGPFEAELLTIAGISSGDGHVKTMSAGFSAGSARTFLANAVGDYITFALGVPQPGTYSIRVRAKKEDGLGTYQLATASTLGGAYTNRGSTMNFQEPAPGSFAEYDLGTAFFTSAGVRYFRFRVTGTSGSGYFALIDYIKLTKQ